MSSNTLMNEMTREELRLFDTVMSARRIQEFLWGHANGDWGLEEWRRMFRKRYQKIDAIDPKNPHALVELKKRLLQNAALSVALLAILDERGSGMPTGVGPIHSNLAEYASDKVDHNSHAPWMTVLDRRTGKVRVFERTGLQSVIRSLRNGEPYRYLGGTIPRVMFWCVDGKSYDPETGEYWTIAPSLMYERLREVERG